MHVVCIHVLLQNVPVFSFATGIVKHGKVSSVCLLGMSPGKQNMEQNMPAIAYFLLANDANLGKK